MLDEKLHLTARIQNSNQLMLYLATAHAKEGYLDVWTGQDRPAELS